MPRPRLSNSPFSEIRGRVPGEKRGEGSDILSAWVSATSEPDTARTPRPVPRRLWAAERCGRNQCGERQGPSGDVRRYDGEMSDQRRNIGSVKRRELREERRKKAARRRYEREKDREREPDAQETLWRHAKNVFIGGMGFGDRP
jgi:hypothetical protein